MPGPNASPHRRRRNRDTKNVPAPVTPTDPPELQATYTVFDGAHDARVRFLQITKDWYAGWCDRGRTAGFGDTDWTFLRDIVAPMFDRARRGGSVERIRELRMQLQTLEKIAEQRFAAKAYAATDDGDDQDGPAPAAVLELVQPGA